MHDYITASEGGELGTRLTSHPLQWPISETDITCDSVTSFGGQIKISEFLVFIDAEDSSEGLVKVRSNE